jgi:hypothetical protein
MGGKLGLYELPEQSRAPERQVRRIARVVFEDPVGCEAAGRGFGLSDSIPSCSLKRDASHQCLEPIREVLESYESDVGSAAAQDAAPF